MSSVALFSSSVIGSTLSSSDTFQSSLKLSFFTFSLHKSSSSFGFSSRRSRRRDYYSFGLARCSLESGLQDHGDDGSGKNISSDLQTSTKNPISLSEIEDFVVGNAGRTPLSRRPRFQLRPEAFRSRPLWRRIFFVSKKVRSIILLNVLTVIYASDISVLKEVEEVMEPALFNMVRFAVSAIPFLPFIFQARKDHRTRSVGIELGFWVSCGYLCQALGLLTSDAGRASFISAFTVIVVPLIDGIFGATIPMLIWSGGLISLLGVALLECDGSPLCVGDILNIFSAVFFGIHMLRTEQISRTTKKDKFLAVLGYEVCVVALSTVVWFLLKHVLGDLNHIDLRSWTWSVFWDQLNSFPWIPALYTGVFSTGLCLWAEMSAMKDISATETAIIYGLEPMWGAAFAWFLLDERWGGTEWIGAALILCGSLTVQILGPISEKFKNENIPLNGSERQKDLSFSTILVNPRKNLDDIHRKQDKL